MAFIGMQLAQKVEDVEEEILDSGSPITPTKIRDLLSNLKRCKVTMGTNGGSKFITEEGNWKSHGHAYLVEITIANIVWVSDMIKKGFKVFFDSNAENCFFCI